MSPAPSTLSSASIAHDEIARFSAQAEEWWNPKGPFRPLHRLNPVRLAYIRDQVGGLKNTRVLDVGCGGGLIAEPLTRLGAKVTGIDASHASIAVARQHADSMGLSIDYRATSVEDLARGKDRYDVITALEIVEHVADLPSFLRAIAALLKPNGTVILSTLNRTPKSFMLGIVAAEYVLRWVPRGTHQWKKFIRPSEMVAALEACNLTTTDLTGVTFDPLQSSFALDTNDLAVNYLLTAHRTAG